MSDYEQAALISYRWDHEREGIVHEIDQALQQRGISDKYLCSPNCMFELTTRAARNQAESKPAPNVSAANDSLASGGISRSGIATSPITNEGVRI